LSFNLILGIIVVSVVLYFVFRQMAAKFKGLGKLFLRSLVAFFGVWAVNIVGAWFGFHIGHNLVTALTIGSLGVPGALLLLAVKYFLI